MLEDLTAVTKRRTRLGVLRELDVDYIQKLPCPGPASTFSPAATLPAHPTAVGRALLAFAPPRTVEMILLRGLGPYTARTVTSPERFRRALAVTRLARVAITREEFETGVNGVAMPVFGPGGRVVAAIEVAVGDLARDLAPTVTALTIATRSLSRELTATHPVTPLIPRQREEPGRDTDVAVARAASAPELGERVFV